MPVAQRLLERLVELLGLEVRTLLQVELHQSLVDLHHLVDDLRVRVGHGGEVAGLPGGLEEAVHDALSAPRREVDRQHLLAEGLPRLLQQGGEVDALGVDLVDDDHPAEPALRGPLEQTLGGHLDARVGVHHHRHRLHGGKHRHGAAEEVGQPRRVDHVQMPAAEIEARDRRVQRVQQVLLQGVEVADRGPLVHATGLRDGASHVQQRLQEGGLTGATGANQRDVADVLRRVAGHDLLASLVPGRCRSRPATNACGRFVSVVAKPLGYPCEHPHWQGLAGARRPAPGPCEASAPGQSNSPRGWVTPRSLRPAAFSTAGREST